MQVEVLRVFVDERGNYGNPLGVVLDGASVPEPAQRQQLAATLRHGVSGFGCLTPRMLSLVCQPCRVTL